MTYVSVLNVLVNYNSRRIPWRMAQIGGVTRMVASLFWPASNIALAAVMKPEKAETADARFAGKPVANTVADHINVELATLPKLALAALAMYYTYPSDLTPFANLGLNAATWTAVRPILLRDLAITWLAAGFWDYIVSFSPLAGKFAGNKFNPEVASSKQRAHDMFWSHVSTVMSTGFEVAILRWYALGVYSPASPAVWWKDVPTLLWVLSMPYWRITHFFVVHRFMHPWRTTSVPDVGAFMYRHVHSLHHKSKNPIAWSGISMHPVESAFYYHAMLVPVMLGAFLAHFGIAMASAHPIVWLYTKVDLTAAALIGHDGIGYPGGGSQGHWLHHHLFECNYSENYVPLDALFNTFAATEEDFQAKFGKDRSRGSAKSKGL